MNTLVSVLLGSLAVVGVACSSDDSSPSNKTSPYDSGYHGQTAEASAPTPPVTIKVVGQGTVTSQSKVTDAGEGLNCSASSTSCTAQIGWTVYATPAAGWSFAYWNVDGTNAPEGGINPNDSLTITDGTPNPLDAVFVQQGTGTPTPAPDAGAPKDAATGG